MAAPPTLNLPSLSDGPTGSVCLGFNTSLEAVIKLIETVIDAIQAPIAQLNSMLNAIVGQAASSIGDIELALDDISADIGNCIPVVEGAGEWLDMMASCGLLENEITAKSPANIAAGFLDGAVNDMAGALEDQLTLLTGLAEMPIAAAINALNSLLESLKIPDHLASFDELVQCMDSICVGVDVSDKLTYISDLLDDNFIDSNGFVLDEQMMNVAGISAAQKDVIIDAKSNLLDTTDTATNQAREAADQGAAAVKSLTTAPARAKSKVKSFFT